MPVLCDFTSIRPPYETAQEQTLDWLAEAHARCSEAEGEAIRAALMHVGCKPEQLAKRGHILADYLHRDWEKMQIYHGREGGAGLGERMRMYEEHVDEIFERFYEGRVGAPDDLIHVSCTGYVSPSGAQKLVSRKKWGEKTTVTHAYHMGCYAAIPALRIARGFAACQRESDIVHTEVCSLHANPALHGTDQLVTQSLFSDGFIKYSVRKQAKGPHLKILALREEILPESIKAMTWKVGGRNFEMKLAKEIPVLIARALSGFLERLSLDAKQEADYLKKKAYFAVHPGGPKILIRVQEMLEMEDKRMTHSSQVFREYGNMSSATLPHIWQRIVDDTTIEDGALIASLAFGPGLSICGAAMIKCGC